MHEKQCRNYENCGEYLQDNDGDLCESCQAEILEFELEELRKDNKCASCTNRGKADGLTQETYCDSCIYAEPWRKDNYNALKGGECERFL